jgi:hypothetical protein
MRSGRTTLKIESGNNHSVDFTAMVVVEQHLIIKKNIMTTEEKIKELENQIEELKKEEEMEQWFKSLLNCLEIAINDNKPKSVFYIKNNEIFFELYQGSEKTCFFCDYNLVWSIFEKKYKLNYYEIQVFIKRMIEQYLKLSKVTPLRIFCAF